MEELCVWAAAVSHPIRLLAEHLGTALFHRSSRSLSLTDAGATLIPEVREAFAPLNNACPYRLCDPDVSVVKAAQDGYRYDAMGST